MLLYPLNEVNEGLELGDTLLHLLALHSQMSLDSFCGFRYYQTLPYSTSSEGILNRATTSLSRCRKPSTYMQAVEN